MRAQNWAAAFFLTGALAGCTPAGTDEVASASVQAPVSLTSEQQIDALIAAMSVERKVAQLIMPDIASITPADVEKYRFGSILNGGNSGPGGDDKAPAAEWLKLADAVWTASTKPLPNGEPAIPTLWATDAVHGHSNIPGATIFPHNIGLGATHDPELMRRIGKATAAEIAVTGIDWTFAPTLAVATDDRWGRTYESFSENPQLVAKLGKETILGFQGEPETEGFLDQTRVLATAKHFFGDGGTAGKDRGDTRGDRAELESIHAAPYPPAIAANVQTAMASFSSINGVKIHGSKELMTDYLRGRLGFGGLVVGDWNGHGELAQCSNDNCPDSLLAGLDIYMVPEDWKGLHQSLLAQVKDGTIPAARLDEAVRRILTVKQAYGLFDKPKPSDRILAGKWSELGSAQHRAISAEAVRKSLVLLKNEGILPIKSSANVLVAGAAADDIAWQSGGWSITWQGGGDLTNADFPGATSIAGGIVQAVKAGGGATTISADGTYSAKPDVAIVVFGEQPFAEFVGDRDDLAFRDEEGLALLEKFSAADVPAVAVFLSGRPLWVAREMKAADAFVAAWLPGSEGQGIADVIIGDTTGKPRHEFSGKLSFGWPASCLPNSVATYPFGFGGRYGAPTPAAAMEADCALLTPDMSQGLAIFGRGLAQSVTAQAADAKGAKPLTNLVGSSTFLKLAPFDINAQEDGRRASWSGAAALQWSWKAQGLPEGAGVALRYRAHKVPTGPITMDADMTGPRKQLNLTSSFDLGAGKGWRKMTVPLACLGSGQLSGLSLSSGNAYELEIDTIDIVPQVADGGCDGPF